MESFEECLLKYRRTLRELLWKAGIPSNPAVDDDWILDEISKLVTPKNNLGELENAPGTLAELVRGERWENICKLFRRNGTTLDVAVGEESMGRYSRVVLDGEGFKVVTERAALHAAFMGGSNPSFRPLTSTEEILALISACDSSLSETGVVATIVEKIGELQRATA